MAAINKSINKPKQPVIITLQTKRVIRTWNIVYISTKANIDLLADIYMKSMDGKIHLKKAERTAMDLIEKIERRLTILYEINHKYLCLLDAYTEIKNLNEDYFSIAVDTLDKMYRIPKRFFTEKI